MVIFDFDLTLVDTQPVNALRAARKWRDVMSEARNLRVYNGVHELLTELAERGETLAIVTKSPDMVPHAFIRQHGWPVDIVLGYHQVKRHKPDPEALVLAMERGAANPEETLHVGDQPEDTEASRAVGITAIGAGWGLSDIKPLEASKPDHLFLSVRELRRFLRERHP